MTAGGGSGSSGSTVTVVWREKAWNSGEIVLARQKLTGMTGVFWNGTVANLLNNIQNLVSGAELPGDHGVYGGGVSEVGKNSDWASVQNALASTSPNVTAFYWWGHGASDGNSIGSYVTARDISILLGNSYIPSLTVKGHTPIAAKIQTRHPYSFVFLDGCCTGTGSLPEVFGIPKNITTASYQRDNKRKRAFMGWRGAVTASLLNTEALSWSLYFWQYWLNNPSITVGYAINQANAHYVPSGGIITYGATSLTYGN
jgi:hypothetical protein